MKHNLPLVRGRSLRQYRYVPSAAIMATPLPPNVNPRTATAQKLSEHFRAPIFWRRSVRTYLKECACALPRYSTLTFSIEILHRDSMQRYSLNHVYAVCLSEGTHSGP